MYFHVDGLQVFIEYKSIQDYGFRKSKTSIISFKKGLPYWWSTSIQRIQEYTRFGFRKLKTSILAYKKGLLYWWSTSIQRIQEYTRICIWKIKGIILLIIRGFHIKGLQVYEEYKGYKILNLGN